MTSKLISDVFLACFFIAIVSANELPDRKRALTEPVEVVVERQSQELATLKADHATLKSDLETTQGAFKVLQTQMNALTDSVRAQLHVLHLGTSGSGGTSGGDVASTFVRWGRSQCPEGAQTVYSGVVGGAYAHDPGAGANRLCMTLEPTFENVTQDQSGEIDGVEYIIPGHHNEDAVCSFCKASYATTFMVPGTTTCPGDAVFQYKGFLSSGYHADEAASEYLCLDSEPENRPGGAGNQNSGYFEHVLAHCGSLPCPPYQEGGVITCV
ncbi:hypothetical protein BaRGS_00028633, partial [Batillaria attramentaria]